MHLYPIYSSRKTKSEKKEINYTSRLPLKYTQSDLGSKLITIQLNSQKKNKSSYKDFHRDYLLKKIRTLRPKLSIDTEDNIKTITSSDFFLTKIEKKYNQTTTTFFSSKSPQLSERNNKTIENLKSNSNSNKVIFQDNNYYPSINYKVPFKFNRNINKCLNKVNGRNHKKLFLSEFNERVKTSFLNNINKETLLKRFKNMKENKDNQIEEINMKIFIIEDMKIKLETFIDNLFQYVRFLYSEIKKQKSIINQLLSYENDLQIEKFSLIKRIKKATKLLDLYKQYKIFLILVKYKKTKLTEIPENELKKYGMEFKKLESSNSLMSHKQSIKFIKNKNSKRKNSIFSILKTIPSKKKKKRRSSIDSLKFISPKPTKRKSVFDTNGIIFTNINQNNNNIPIFDSTEEFIYKMNYLENEVRELFIDFSEMKYNDKELYKEKDSIKEYDNKEEKVNIEIYEKNIKELYLIKEENRILNIKYNNLIQSYTERNFGKKIFLKIKKCLLSLPINIEIDFNIVNFYNLINSNTYTVMVHGKKYNKSIFGLSILEMILIHYETIIKRLICDYKIKTIYDKLISDLQKQKRIEKNKELKMKRNMKFEELSQKIMMKSQRIFFPARKIDIYENLLIRNRVEKEEEIKRLKNMKKKKDNQYEEWIVY